MKFKTVILELFTAVVPLLKEFIKSSVIPKMVRKTYERFDEYANDMIENLSELVEKIKDTQDEEKKKNHLEGLSLGLKAFRAIAKKLNEACDIIEKEIVA